MGLLWTGSLAIYGAASTRLAAMGPVLGWPLFMSVIIITSNLWGFATGEWKGASRGAVTTMLVGILLLPWHSVKLTRVALRFIDPESLPIPFQVVRFSVRWWVNLSEQKWVNSGERYRLSSGLLYGGVRVQTRLSQVSLRRGSSEATEAINRRSAQEPSRCPKKTTVFALCVVTSRA
jgi:hypothetical protein